jgi:DNA-binding beta-propeller fold protein YncE
VFVVDGFNNRILDFEFRDAAEPIVTWWWGSAGSVDGTFYQPSGVAVDDEDFVYVVDSRPRIQVFRPEGDFVSSFGSWGYGPGELGVPHDVATDRGRVYVVDSNHQGVSVFHRTGDFLDYWAIDETPDGSPLALSALAPDADGNLHVLVTRSRVDVFDVDGQLVRSWGEAGPAPGQLDLALDLVVVGDTVFIVDFAKRSILNFDRSGRYLGVFGALPESVTFPIRLSATPEEHIILSTQRMLFEYDETGTVIVEWNTDAQCPSPFEDLRDVCSDARGTLFVADAGAQRILAFSQAFRQDLPMLAREGR